jgi:histidinol-phosphate aminotransferase
MASYGLPEWIRISVGTMDQNRRCVEELKVLAKEGKLAAPKQP